MFGRILVALDGSASSGRAGRVALEMATRFASRVTLVTVRPAGVGADEAYLDSLVPRGDEGKSLVTQIEELKREATTRGIAQLDAVSLTGPVAESILEFLETHPHDLVVVGSRGLSRGSRLILRSVSEQLVHGAPCPVLVVRGSRKPRPAAPPLEAPPPPERGRRPEAKR